MISKKHPYAILNQQFRMIPEIAALLKDIYPTLVTLPVERDIPQTHLAHPVYWWEHDAEETRGVSPWNQLEVEKVCALARFLLMHVEPARITVLAGYQGQVSAIREHLAKRCTEHKDTSKLLKLQVRTVDSYQGSENDIVLLTLVRNNPARALGFMEHPGRRCVALSRARLALYIVGSRNSFEGTEWGRVIWELEARGCMGHGLELMRCNGEVREVHTADELFTICDEVQKKGIECL